MPQVQELELNQSPALVEDDAAIDLQSGIRIDDINVAWGSDFSSDGIIAADSVMPETEFAKVFQVSSISPAKGVDPDGEFSEIVS